MDSELGRKESSPCNVRDDSAKTNKVIQCDCIFSLLLDTCNGCLDENGLMTWAQKVYDRSLDGFRGEVLDSKANKKGEKEISSNEM